MGLHKWIENSFALILNQISVVAIFLTQVKSQSNIERVRYNFIQILYFIQLRSMWMLYTTALNCTIIAMYVLVEFENLVMYAKVMYGNTSLNISRNISKFRESCVCYFGQ